MIEPDLDSLARLVTLSRSNDDVYRDTSPVHVKRLEELLGYQYWNRPEAISVSSDKFEEECEQTLRISEPHDRLWAVRTEGAVRDQPKTAQSHG